MKDTGTQQTGWLKTFCLGKLKCLKRLVVLVLASSDLDLQQTYFNCVMYSFTMQLLYTYLACICRVLVILKNT